MIGVVIVSKMKKMCGKGKEFFLQGMVPNFYAFWAERKLTDTLNKLKERNFDIQLNGGQDNKELIKDLNKFHLKEIERKGKIEDKAKASLFIIALSITLILGSLKFINDIGDRITSNFWALLILIAGVIYLLLSGITSIKAINIREFYDVYLNDTFEESNCELNIKKIDDKQKIELYYKNIKLNQLITNIRGNYVYATFVGIRNGITLISLFFIMMVGSMYLDNLVQYNEKIKNKALEKPVINSKIKQNKSSKKSLDKIIKMNKPLFLKEKVVHADSKTNEQIWFNAIKRRTKNRTPYNTVQKGKTMFKKGVRGVDSDTSIRTINRVLN